MIIYKIKKFLKKILPERLFLFYHYLLAIFAALYYRFPSKKLIIIGVTGTKGKTSTVNFIHSCLIAGGYKAGFISTANINTGNEEILNKYHMTMPGRFMIQKLIAEMVKNQCKFCIIETTSEGIKQYRHKFIDYDIAIFTNLSPEHLESHSGSFEKYMKTKGEMFKALQKTPKFLDGKKINKIIIVNKDNEYNNYFLNFKADKKITFGIFNKNADFVAENIIETNNGVNFQVKGHKFKINILGRFNVYNALPSIIIGCLFNIKWNEIKSGLKKLRIIPGRMEIINEGQNFNVIVDYAHEKESIKNVLQTANNLRKSKSKIIILLGAEGGGRDKSKRPIMGELSAKMADYIIVSNVDPYEDDPKQILEEIAIASEKFGKIRDKNLFVIDDRTLGIRKALSLAKENDIVLITGKGAEQSIIINGKKIEWDDRIIVRKELKMLLGQM